MTELMRLLSPATRAIVIACRAKLTPACENELDASLIAVNDWSAFSEHVERHRVSSILGPALAAKPEALVPRSTARALATRAKLQTFKAQHLTDELLRMTQICSERDIQTLHYKGATAAIELYGGLHRRPFGDLDFLVRRDQIEQLIDVFQQEGYVATLPENFRARSLHYRYRKEVELRSAGFVFEPHFAFAPASQAFDPGFDLLWARSSSLTVAGERANGVLHTPHIEDAVLIYAVAGAILDWRRLPKIMDFSRALQRLQNDTADPRDAWRRVNSHAVELGWQRALHVSCLLAAGLLKTPLPDYVVRQAQADVVAGKIVHEVATTLDKPISTHRFLPQHHRIFKPIRWHSRERLVDRLRYLVRTTTVPEHSLVQRLPLPNWLTPVYFAITVLTDYLAYPVARFGLFVVNRARSKLQVSQLLDRDK